jgi:hypothetical protein
MAQMFEAITNSSVYTKVSGFVKHDLLYDLFSANWTKHVVTIIVTLAILEQVWFQIRRLRYGYKGPLFVVPFVGGACDQKAEPSRDWNRRFTIIHHASRSAALISMIWSPYAFWEKQRQFDPSGASCNSIFNWFIVRRWPIV